jgi:hypothetical protein
VSWVVVNAAICVAVKPGIPLVEIPQICVGVRAANCVELSAATWADVSPFISLTDNNPTWVVVRLDNWSAVRAAIPVADKLENCVLVKAESCVVVKPETAVVDRAAICVAPKLAICVVVKADICAVIRPEIAVVESDAI